MREISELIYETCKTYLITQGKFLLILEAFIGVIIVLYFGVLLKFEAVKVLIILLFSLVGLGGGPRGPPVWERGQIPSPLPPPLAGPPRPALPPCPHPPH